MWLVTGRVFLGLGVVLTFLLLLGRNWVRVFFTIAGAIVIVTTIIDIAMSDFRSAYEYLDMAVSVAATVLLWLPSSNRFFRDKGAVRAALKRERYRDKAWLRPESTGSPLV
jgi:hypothetical protein